MGKTTKGKGNQGKSKSNPGNQGKSNKRKRKDGTVDVLSVVAEQGTLQKLEEQQEATAARIVEVSARIS